MKKSIVMLTAGLFIGAICCYDMLFMIHDDASSEPALQKSDSVSLKEEPRESITFILGEDKEKDNRYYDEATRYYRSHPEGRTMHIITGCRSLIEVRNYLEGNKPANSLPWGLVHLVSHGNQWTGLSVRVTPDSKRTTASVAEEYIGSSAFKPLPSTIADSRTEIFLHGCGVGNNHNLVHNIARLFGGEDSRIVVRASRMFEYYASIDNGTAAASQRYLANAWHVSYKMGEQPPVGMLINELREKYPGVAVDWRDALSRTKPRRVGEVYHYTFEVPVRWTIPCRDSVPDVTTPANQLYWLRQQEVVMTELTNLGIPPEKFKWTFRKGYITETDNKQVPAMAVKGYCTILCVLQAITLQSDQEQALSEPFIPDVNDSNYYYSTRSMFSQLSDNKVL